MSAAAQPHRTGSVWDGVFAPSEAILWSGKPDRIRALASRLAVALAALSLAGTLAAWGGVWATAGLIGAFFLTRAFWINLLGIRRTYYAVSTDHIAIRHLGYRHGFLTFPLKDFFLQQDLGLVRVFPRRQVSQIAPAARLWHLPAKERARALRAAGEVPRTGFHLPRTVDRKPWSELLPDIFEKAGLAEAAPPKTDWDGNPTKPHMVMPLIIPALAAMGFFAGAAIAAAKGLFGLAAWCAFGALAWASVEVVGFQELQRRARSARYAIVGRYAIRIDSGRPFLSRVCDIRRISAYAPISVDATTVFYGQYGWLGRHGWYVVPAGFYEPSNAPQLLDHLKHLAGNDPRWPGASSAADGRTVG